MGSTHKPQTHQPAPGGIQKLPTTKPKNDYTDNKEIGETAPGFAQVIGQQIGRYFLGQTLGTFSSFESQSRQVDALIHAES
jgi:hypothetical protein